MTSIPTPKTYKFSSQQTRVYYNGRMSQLSQLCKKKKSVLVTEENVYAAHKKKFTGWNIIVTKAGEEFKTQATADAVIDQLIEMKAGREVTIVGVGGGMITDLVGYVAAIYMRGVRCGFVPTTLLALVDASLGGKNGVDVGVYKNLVGTIRQPAFILHDYSLLNTLPDAEWRNGFAEIIKHACLGSPKMFRLLESKNPAFFRRDKPLLAALIRQNAEYKIKLVARDEMEKNERRLLNFGHTLGHALEKLYELSHGEAISIGMNLAAKLSASLAGFNEERRLADLLQLYGLPVQAVYDKGPVLDLLVMDKKRSGKSIHFVLLQGIGDPVIRPIPLSRLKQLIAQVR